MLLMLTGGTLLVVGLVAPWYYRYEEEEYYSMSAIGGSLVDELATDFFSPLGAYISLCFAIVSVLFPFVSTKLSEGSQRKYVTVLSCFTGICALMNIVYIHSWLGLVFPGTSFIYYGLNVSCGPAIGYFLTWAAMALLFASTYVSQGLTQESTKVES
ncbi:MAG: hypothetical protein ACE5J6_01945 [Candidatus Bathyarchaeia archaeon]